MTNNVFQNKNIILGITGGIASYKAVDLASKLARKGTTVKVIMTRNATRFVNPITFQSITGQPVLVDLFDDTGNDRIPHVSINEGSDLFVVAPATANILAKAAHGIADDALSTSLLATGSTIVMVPSMNNRMWFNEATQQNLETLKSRGVHIIEPDVGRLACGEQSAAGRFPDTERITNYLTNLLVKEKDLKGRVVLVTAGGTHEPVDAVRFVGNRSSGKMGYAVAGAAQMRGARVILVSGPTSLKPPYGVELINIETAGQMHDAIMGRLDQLDIIVMAAAVADFKPSKQSDGKIKKKSMPTSIEIELNPDILSAVSEKKGRTIVIGFAAESENIIENATEKLKKKDLDLIVANDIGRSDAGFGSDFNRAVLINSNGPMGDIEVYRKTELAEKIIDWSVSRIQESRP